jgi:hypothetical protein
MPQRRSSNSNSNNDNNNKTITSTVMRIQNQHLIFGVILLLRLFLIPRAYTLNNVFHLPPSMHRTSLWLSPLINKDGFRNSVVLPTTTKSARHLPPNLLLFQSTSPSSQEELATSSVEIDFTIPAKQNNGHIYTTKTSRNTITTTISAATTCLAMAILFWVSQFVGGWATSPKAAATTSADDGRLLYSAVSATLLRREKGSKWKLLHTQNILLCLFLFQGMPPIGHSIQCLWTLGGIFSTWYTGVLHQFPLITKSLTAAMIGFLGDTAAQFIEERLQAKKDGTNIEPFHHYDQRRGLAVLGDSLLISGPLLHVAYDWLERAIPVAGPYATLAAMSHVLIDNFLLDAVFVAAMFVSTGIVEGYTKQILPQLKKDYFNTLKTGWATSITLMPLVFVCFRFLPVSFRVLGMNIIDIFWEAIISYMVHRRRRSAKLQEQSTTTDAGPTTTTTNVMSNKIMHVLATEGAATI